MEKENNKQNAKPGLGFRLFKAYIRFFHDKIYYKKVYWLNSENIPDKGPLMIVSDHQNCLSDALGVLMSIPNRKERKLRILSRADIFKPVFSKALRWLGIMPSFRLLYEGEESLSNNSMTFEESENELLNDGTVIIYPEAGHQDKHWLGHFSLAYLHILFEAAKRSNYEKELFILPSCNHYSNYYNMQEEILIRYGTPISIAPYYELYKTKPRTAQRQVNALVRQQLSEMMLNITDVDNYESIDYIRNAYGVEYAREKGFDPRKLPEKLLADKQLFARLEAAKEVDPKAVQTLYDEASFFGEKVSQLKLNDWNFSGKVHWMQLLAEGLLFVLLFPLFLVTYIPNLFIFYMPRLITCRLNDRMFYSSINFGASVLITIPVTSITFFLLAYFTTKSILLAFISIFCLPFFAIFAFCYMKRLKRWFSKLRFNSLFKQGKLNDLIVLRKHIFESLDKLLA